jgi:hypothetical protein
MNEQLNFAKSQGAKSCINIRRITDASACGKNKTLVNNDF